MFYFEVMQVWILLFTIIYETIDYNVYYIALKYKVESVSQDCIFYLKKRD